MENHPWHILLVEDDEEDYILTRALLSDFPGRRFQLTWAKTVESALEQLYSPPPDAVLVDYALGPSSGLDFIRQALASGCPAPFILLTGHGGYEIDLLAMQAGADDYLSKGELSPYSLERAIRYAIERKATERALRRAREELELRVQERTEQLHKSNEALAQANTLLERVFSSIHLLVAYLDRDFHFIRVNENYALAGGLEPEAYIGKNHFDLYPDEEAERIFLAVVETGEPYFVFSRPFIYPDKTENEVTYWDWSLQPVKEPDGQVSGLILSLLDVTQRYRAALALRRREELLDRVSDAILAADENYILNAWNEAAEVIYGWKAEEALGKDIDELLKTEYIGGERAAIWEKTRVNGKFQGEVIQYTRDETPIYLETKITVLKDERGNIIGYAAVNRDITERKRIQAELVEVQRRLIDSVESERQRIARELHDGPMQELYGLAYEIEALRSAVSMEEVSRLQNKLRQISQTLRVTATELRPPTLAPFGLEKAIRSHAQRFQEDYSELEIFLDLDADGQDLPERVRLALFRIYQQSLANVVRHAQASRVEVRLKLDAEGILLEVKDNGCGFVVPDRWVELARKGHLGLVGAQERAGAIGGTLTVVSQPGQGTVIQVCVPRSA